MSSLISIVIPTFQRSNFLEKAIYSAANQDYSNVEILVVDDNNDTDESKKVIEIISQFPKAKYIKNFRSKGGCGARNSGILEAKGEYIAFLDDDDYWCKDKLTIQTDFFVSNNRDVVLVSCDHYVLNANTNQKSIKRFPFNILTFELAIKGNCPSSTSLIIAQKDILMQAGLFDESLPSFQDYDMWLRCLKLGKLVNVNKPLAVFVNHSDSRVSINLDRRLKGLSLITAKWEKEIEKIYSIKKFRTNFISVAYFHHATSVIKISYFKAVFYLLRCISLRPFVVGYWYWLLIAILGKRIGLALDKFLHS